MNSEALIGLLVVLFAIAATLLYSRKRIQSRRGYVPRQLAEITRLKRALGMAVEDGSRIHIALGNGGLTTPTGAATLSALDSLEALGMVNATSDHPPLSTSGDGAAALLSKDVLHHVSYETNTRDLYDPDDGTLTGISPFSYAVGNLDMMRDAEMQTHLFIGNFGMEAGLLADRAEETGNYSLAASDSLTAQSVFYASSRDVLIGEELFALPAYLANRPAYLVSLQVQDLLRVMICLTLLTGAVLKLLGLL